MNMSYHNKNTLTCSRYPVAKIYTESNYSIDQQGTSKQAEELSSILFMVAMLCFAKINGLKV